MRFGILGAGNWGSVFGIMLLESGHDPLLWEYDAERARQVSRTRDNSPFLTDMPLPEEIKISSDLDEVVDKADFLVLAIPSQAVAQVVKGLPTTIPILSLVKGIDLERMKRISELLSERINGDLIAVLSGPSIANEIKDRRPASVVVVSTNENLCCQLQKILSNKYFRVYRSDDLIGVELGGAYKNTIAIACGICDGLGFGTNAKSALISRGLVEMKRFTVESGGRGKTVFGLAGLGDIITTSFSLHSRNRRLGEEIGKGKEPKEVIKEIVMVAEGYYSTPAFVTLGKQIGVDLPIARAINSILHHGQNPLQVAEDLMLRPLKSEGE